LNDFLDWGGGKIGGGGGNITLLGQRQMVAGVVSGVAGKIEGWLVLVLVVLTRQKKRKKRWWGEEKIETGEKTDFFFPNFGF